MIQNLTVERYAGKRGMGSTQTTAAIESIAATGASTTVATLVAMGTIAGPVGIAITGLIGAAISIASLFKGCGQTCIAATHIADQAGQIIDQAFFAYMNAPIHYASMQNAYLNLFDSTMQAMDQACSDPSLGAAGQRCISERQPGACPFKTPSGQWIQDAAGKWSFDPNSGPLCWNSYIGRRDPVANDPTVVPDPTPSTQLANAITSGAGGNLLTSITSGGIGPLMLIGGLALIGWVFMSKDK